MKVPTGQLSKMTITGSGTTSSTVSSPQSTTSSHGQKRALEVPQLDLNADVMGSMAYFSHKRLRTGGTGGMPGYVQGNQALTEGKSFQASVPQLVTQTPTTTTFETLQFDRDPFAGGDSPSVSSPTSPFSDTELDFSWSDPHGNYRWKDDEGDTLM